MSGESEHKSPRGTRAARLQRDEYAALRLAIERAMQEAGIGQRELSRRIGQTFAITYKILSGQRTVEFTELIDISRAIGVEPASLVSIALAKE